MKLMNVALRYWSSKFPVKDAFYNARLIVDSRRITGTDDFLIIFDAGDPDAHIRLSGDTIIQADVPCVGRLADDRLKALLTEEALRTP